MAMKLPNEASRINPRKQPKQKRSIKRFETILESAETLIVTHGVAQMKMTDIAIHAGVPVGSVYQFFPEKAAILKAILDLRLSALMQAVKARLTDVRSEADARSRIAHLIEDGAHIHLHNPLCRELWMATSVDPDLGHLQYQAHEEIGALALDVLGPFVGDQHPASERDRFVLVSLLTGSVLRCLAEGNDRAGALLEEWKKLVCDIVLPPRTSTAPD
ncbi:AcrR family transcriptional regulator [Agrobacterium vitis]|nr:AcrR family transcriptional regulator [Agrobacterium vitis]MBE1436738.1 AcrR family transcriptional regulator [Agrobacterium vitis]